MFFYEIRWPNKKTSAMASSAIICHHLPPSRTMAQPSPFRPPCRCFGRAWIGSATRMQQVEINSRPPTGHSQCPDSKAGCTSGGLKIADKDQKVGKTRKDCPPSRACTIQINSGLKAMYLSFRKATKKKRILT